MKTCVVCGKLFACPPSSKKITCSAECSTVRKQQTHLGKRNKWSEQAKERKRAEGQNKNLKRGTAAALLSPNSGPFETNINAKHWKLKSPDNVIYEVDNLTKFVRDNPKFFPNPTSARSALSASAACIAGVASPSRKHRQFGQYKGWQVMEYGAKQEK